MAETAFFVPRGSEFDLRWFTPTVEVDLCGHATLASGFVLMTKLEPQRGRATFHTRSGPLTVARDGDRLTMDFPARPPSPTEAPEGFAEALGAWPTTVLKSRDFVAVFDSAAQVRALKPDLVAIARLDSFAVSVTAPGHRRRRRRRFRVALLRAGARRARGSGDRLGALQPGAAMGGAARQDRAARPPGQRARWRGSNAGSTGDRVHLAGDAVLVMTGLLHL